MKRFLDMLESSVIVQSLLALIIVGCVVFLYATNQAVPDALLNITMLILGFYFGAKATIAERRGYNRARAERKDE